MPALLINIVNGSWVAQVANTNITYAFAGDTLAMQAVRVRNLSFAMELNQTENLPQFFANPGVDSQTLSTQLFGGTDTIVYEGDVIYGAVGDEFLIDELAEAGMALAAVL